MRDTKVLVQATEHMGACSGSMRGSEGEATGGGRWGKSWRGGCRGRLRWRVRGHGALATLVVGLVTLSGGLTTHVTVPRFSDPPVHKALGADPRLYPMCHLHRTKCP